MRPKRRSTIMSQQYFYICNYIFYVCNYIVFKMKLPGILICVTQKTIDYESAILLCMQLRHLNTNEKSRSKVNHVKEEERRKLRSFILSRRRSCRSKASVCIYSNRKSTCVVCTTYPIRLYCYVIFRVNKTRKIYNMLH